MSTATQARLTEQAGELACLVALAADLAAKAHNKGDEGAAWQVSALLRAMTLQANALHDLAGELGATGGAA